MFSNKIFQFLSQNISFPIIKSSANKNKSKTLHFNFTTIQLPLLRELIFKRWLLPFPFTSGHLRRSWYILRLKSFPSSLSFKRLFLRHFVKKRDTYVKSQPSCQSDTVISFLISADELHLVNRLKLSIGPGIAILN